MGFSRQEYRSGVPLHSGEDFLVDWSEIMSRREELMLLMSLEWMDLSCCELQWDGMRRLERSWRGPINWFGTFYVWDPFSIQVEMSGGQWDMQVWSSEAKPWLEMEIWKSSVFGYCLKPWDHLAWLLIWRKRDLRTGIWDAPTLWEIRKQGREGPIREVGGKPDEDVVSCQT